MTRAETFKSASISLIIFAIMIAALVAIPVDAQEIRGEASQFSKRIGSVNHLNKLKHGEMIEDFDELPQEVQEKIEARRAEKEARLAEMESRRAEHAQEMANELGITVEELKEARDNPEFQEKIQAFMEANRAEHLEEIALEKGVSVEELQEMMANRPKLNNGQKSKFKNGEKPEFGQGERPVFENGQKPMFEGKIKNRMLEFMAN